MSRSQMRSRTVPASSSGIVAAALLGALLIGGCSTDVQVLNRSQQSREQGIRMYNEGSYAEAAGAFKNAVRQDGRDYKSQYYLGASYEALRQYEQAIEAYKASFDALDTSLEGQENVAFRERIMNSLSSLVAKVDDRGVQRSTLEKQAREKKSGREYWLLARVCIAAGDPDGAIDAYANAARLSPQDFVIAKEAGLYLVKLGQAQKAEAALRRAYRLNHNDAQVAAALRQIGVAPSTVLEDPKDIIPAQDNSTTAQP